MFHFRISHHCLLRVMHWCLTALTNIYDVIYGVTRPQRVVPIQCHINATLNWLTGPIHVCKSPICSHRKKQYTLVIIIVSLPFSMRDSFSDANDDKHPPIIDIDHEDRLLSFKTKWFGMLCTVKCEWYLYCSCVIQNPEVIENEVYTDMILTFKNNR